MFSLRGSRMRVAACMRPIVGVIALAQPPSCGSAGCGSQPRCVCVPRVARPAWPHRRPGHRRLGHTVAPRSLPPSSSHLRSSISCSLPGVSMYFLSSLSVSSHFALLCLPALSGSSFRRHGGAVAGNEARGVHLRHADSAAGVSYRDDQAGRAGHRGSSPPAR